VGEDTQGGVERDGISHRIATSREKILNSMA